MNFSILCFHHLLLYNYTFTPFLTCLLLGFPLRPFVIGVQENSEFLVEMFTERVMFLANICCKCRLFHRSEWVNKQRSLIDYGMKKNLKDCTECKSTKENADISIQSCHPRGIHCHPLKLWQTWTESAIIFLKPWMFNHSHSKKHHLHKVSHNDTHSIYCISHINTKAINEPNNLRTLTSSSSRQKRIPQYLKTIHVLRPTLHLTCFVDYPLKPNKITHDRALGTITGN